MLTLVPFPPVVEVTFLLQREKKGRQVKQPINREGEEFRARCPNAPVWACQLGAPVTSCSFNLTLLPVNIYSQKLIKVIYTLGFFKDTIHMS